MIVREPVSRKDTPLRLRTISLLAMLMASLIASATTVIPMTIERITQSSTLVAEGRAIDVRSEWNAEHTIIYTYTHFQKCESRS